MALTHALSTNNYGESHLIVATSAANGTHTTLAGAMADAVSGDTIFLRDSVTENVTLTPGVNVTAWTGGTLNTPKITGTLTMTAAGTCNLNGLELQTNSAAAIVVSGSAASILNINNCYLNFTNNNGITFSTSSPSAKINIVSCQGDLGTTGIKIFDQTSAGLLQFFYCTFTNTGASVTASTASAGTLYLYYTNTNSPITTSSTNALSAGHAGINTLSLNTTSLTSGGSGNATIQYCGFSSGSASAISISNTTTLTDCVVGSSNTNAVTGAGTVTYHNLSFNGTSLLVNTTTQTNCGTVIGLRAGNAPAAGFLGESISSTASAVATTSATAKTIASITLTPGVWDVSCIASGEATGGTAIMTAIRVNISTTDNTITGTLGIDYFQINVTAGTPDLSGVVPSIRKTISANTTYYLVVQNFYTSTTCPTNGRINATRVG